MRQNWRLQGSLAYTALRFALPAPSPDSTACLVRAYLCVCVCGLKSVVFLELWHLGFTLVQEELSGPPTA